MSCPHCGLDEVRADSQFNPVRENPVLEVGTLILVHTIQCSLSRNRDLLLQLLTIVRHSK